MKKIFILLLAVLMLSLCFTGCGQGAASDTQETAGVSETASGGVSAPAEESAAVSDMPVSGAGTPAESYTAFVKAKSAVITKLSDGLSKNKSTVFASMTLLGASMADLVMLPVSFFGAGGEAASTGLKMLNASDVQYSENGNTYSITYTDEQGDTYVFNGTYDAAADALACTAQKAGKDFFYSEYRRTSYGYVSQYYFINDDDTTSLYQFAISGEDGTFGVSTTQASQPAALTGSEAADFPAALPEWYSIQGSVITGLMSDGTEIDFEYEPSVTE